MLLGILLVIQILVCLALIAVVLLQRSEGGALGMGGGPSGFMSARGAGDLLTRITWILATIFFALSLTITLVSGRMNGGSALDRLQVESINPEDLQKQPLIPQPATPAEPAADENAPLQAPAAKVRNPFAEDETPAQPAAPAP